MEARSPIYRVNIASHLASMAKRLPNTPAIYCPIPNSSELSKQYSHLTFQQLESLSNEYANGFLSLGLFRNTRVALMVPPSLDFFALTFALFKIGAVPVLIDPGIGVKQLGKGLQEAAPEAFVGVLKAHAARFFLGWAKTTLRLLVTVGGPALFGGVTLQKVRSVAQGNQNFEISEPNPGETAAILFTSGSTGPSKGVVYTHEFFNAQVDQIRNLYNIQPGEIDLPTFPLFSLFGPALGMTSVIPDMDPTRPANVDPRKIIRAVEHFKVTNMFGSPALIRRVGKYAESQGLKLPTLRRVISAGAPVHAKALKPFCIALNDSTQVFTPYGATECLPVSSIGSHEILGETSTLTDSGMGVCVGKPVPGLELKIITITDNPIERMTPEIEQPQGQIGEITVRALHTTQSYFARPEATQIAKIPDPPGNAWHRMGDVGYLDTHGRVWFCGRKSHRVITKQGTCFTIPVEGIFNSHPMVYRSALVGVPFGNDVEPVICIELENSHKTPDKTEIKADLLNRAARFECSKNIKFLLFHNSFPVDIRHNAKIFREKLALWAADQIKGRR